MSTDQISVAYNTTMTLGKWMYDQQLAPPTWLPFSPNMGRAEGGSHVTHNFCSHSGWEAEMETQKIKVQKKTKALGKEIKRQRVWEDVVETDGENKPNEVKNCKCWQLAWVKINKVKN